MLCIRGADTGPVTRVQFREDDDTVAFVAKAGMNPNELARDLFRAEVRRMRAKAKFERLRARNIQLPASSAEIIRELRDGR